MKPKPKLHHSGLLLSLVQLHKKGTKPLGRVSQLCLEHWEESERLRERVKELETQVETLTNAIRHNTKY